MPIKKITLDQELQDFFGSLSNIKADSGKRYRALNTALNKLQQYNWMFTIKKVSFSYLAATNEYSLETDLSITDFKSHYFLDGKNPIDARQFNPDVESIAYRVKNGVNYLLCNLGSSDDTFDFEYFSTGMVKNTGTLATQEEFSADEEDESFVGPTDMKPLIVQMAYFELLRKTKNIDKKERIEVQNDITDLFNKAFFNYGYTPKKGIKRIKSIK